jgi:hypothetical protein
MVEGGNRLDCELNTASQPPLGARTGATEIRKTVGSASLAHSFAFVSPFQRSTGVDVARVEDDRLGQHGKSKGHAKNWATVALLFGACSACTKVGAPSAEASVEPDAGNTETDSDTASNPPAPGGDPEPVTTDDCGQFIGLRWSASLGGGRGYQDFSDGTALPIGIDLLPYVDVVAEVDPSHPVPEYEFANVDVALFRSDGALMNRYGFRPPGQERMYRNTDMERFYVTLGEAGVLIPPRGREEDGVQYESVDGAAGQFRFEVTIPGKCHLIQEIPVIVTTNFFTMSDRKIPIFFYDRPLPGAEPPADTDPPPTEYGGYETGQP